MSQSSILKTWQTCLLTVELVKPTLDLRRHAEDTSRLQGSRTWGSLVFEAGRLWVMAYCLAKFSPMNKSRRHLRLLILFFHSTISPPLHSLDLLTDMRHDHPPHPPG